MGATARAEESGESATRFAITHATPGRLRLRVPALYRRPTVARELVELARDVSGVRVARADARTATVLVTFAKDIGVDAVEAKLDAALRELDETDLHRTPGARAPIAGGALAPFAAWLRSTLRSPGHPREPAPGEGEQQLELEWHRLGAQRVVRSLESADAGLDDASARMRLQRFGPNVLGGREPRSAVAIVLGQLASVPNALLTGTALLSLATGGVADAVAIFAVMLINTGIGYTTESRAERTILELERPARRTARVRRGGAIREVDASELVPGDVITLGGVMFVPADVRLLTSDGLMIDESTLTGESVPVAKDAARVGTEGYVPLAERFNMAFRSTLVTSGSGVGVVVATGQATELGRIQSLAGATDRPVTPMQAQLARLGTQLVVLSGVVCTGVFFIGWARGYGLVRILKTALSLAVAAVPEGLPTVATTTLSLGIHPMRGVGVLVRRLDAIETLGAVQMICFDKTGTVTENRMSVVEVVAGRRQLVVENGALVDGQRRASPSRDPALDMLLRVLLLCSEAKIDEGAESRPDARADGSVATARGVALRGSPTEVALARLAIDAGLDLEKLRARFPLVRIRERSESRMWMDTLHLDGEGRLLAVKGRPTDVLALASRVWCRRSRGSGWWSP